MVRKRRGNCPRTPRTRSTRCAAAPTSNVNKAARAAGRRASPGPRRPGPPGKAARREGVTGTLAFTGHKQWISLEFGTARVVEPVTTVRRPRNMRVHEVALSMVVGLVAVGVTACGTGPDPARPAGQAGASAGSAAASPPVIATMPGVPAGSAAPTGQIFSNRQALTVASDGARVRLRVGQWVTVVLVSRGLAWDVPKSSGSAVRRTSVSGGYPTGLAARAVFRAVRRGASSLTSVTDAKCLHAQPRCELMQRLWRVTVIVTNR